ncbi:hypothetical protein [Pelagicoccus sp. SDUM812003]|uniref:hypothetical protein n=1 Tax=Pelagicoccus sp. SDUM812003 TaxID=3041267 RepID=UPI00280C68B5|nr:hypothetical protein [Pelagicoccus sp. SDUM812003]MDQ8201665.1 hypothetical protein [Pelagicoccus sp. SDUM812003]
MPIHPQHRLTAETDARLSQLIQLKKLERPDAAFWQRFEQEFRSKQLSSLVRVQPWRTRLYRLALVAARRAAPPTTALGAIALSLVALTNTSFLVQDDREDPSETKLHDDPKTPNKPQFVVGSETTPNDPLAPAFHQPLEFETHPVYQMNVMQNPLPQAEAYRLNAMPVTFSSGYDETAERPDLHAPLGAKVIRAQKQF